MSAGWPAAALEQYRGLKHAVEARNFTDAARAVAFLRNVLVRVTVFRESLAAVRTPSELIAEPFERFLKLPPPSANPSPADDGLAFSRAPLSGAGVRGGRRHGRVAQRRRRAADGCRRRTRAARGRRGGSHDPVPGWRCRCAADAPTASSRSTGTATSRWISLWPGRGGVRLFVQQDDGSFADATAKAAGSEHGVDADCFGVWAADIEMDGDLDLVVGVNGAAPLVLRNNGDGTWRQLQPFAGVVGVRAFAWGDIDGDGDPDAAIVGERGDLHVFENRQGGEFRETAGPAVWAPSSR